jgi:DNA-directed RNA polymerase subunit RPC12/RpoP
MDYTKPGQWYFLFSCANCGKPVVFAEAESGDAVFETEAEKIELTCPYCNTRHAYTAAEVEIGQGA